MSISRDSQLLPQRAFHGLALLLRLDVPEVGAILIVEGMLIRGDPRDLVKVELTVAGGVVMDRPTVGDGGVDGPLGNVQKIAVLLGVDTQVAGVIDDFCVCVCGGWVVW